MEGSENSDMFQFICFKTTLTVGLRIDWAGDWEPFARTQVRGDGGSGGRAIFRVYFKGRANGFPKELNRAQIWGSKMKKGVKDDSKISGGGNCH